MVEIFGYEMKRKKDETQLAPQKVTHGLEDAVKAEVGTKYLDLRLKELDEFLLTFGEECPECKGETVIKLTAGVWNKCPRCKGEGRLKSTESEASMMMKSAFITTFAFGEMGDRYKVSVRSMMAFQKLLRMVLHSQQKFGIKHPWTVGLRKLLFSAYSNLLFRSLSSKHTDVNTVVLPPEYFMGGKGWKQRRDSLEY